MSYCGAHTPQLERLESLSSKGIIKCGEKKKIRKRLCLPLAPSVAPICAPASPDREGAGRDRRSCVPCAVHHTLCSTQLTQLTVWSSSAHCAQSCVLLYSSGKVSVVCRGVTLAPTAHPTANVVSQGKAPSLPKSVQIWLIGRDISQNSKNSSLNPRPFFIWMLLVASNRKNIYSMGMYLLCRSPVKSESFEVRICQFQCGHELAVSASVTLNQSE